jgi:hypothetical protein
LYVTTRKESCEMEIEKTTRKYWDNWYDKHSKGKKESLKSSERLWKGKRWG